MKNQKHTLVLLIALIVSPLGCSPSAPPKTVTLSQAQEKFVKICREELKYDVRVFPNGKTMWVYVPLKDMILDFRAAPKNKAPKAEADKNWSINFLEAKYENKNFTVSFDIAMAKKYDKEVTYQNKPSEEYSKKQRQVLIALTRAYFDVGQSIIDAPLSVGKSQSAKDEQATIEKMKSNPITRSADQTPPDFFVMIFADTKRGVGIKSINYFPDMRMALSDPPAISNDEFAKRYVYELYGDEDMIGDTEGSRVKTSEIALGDFLAKQLESRIKYQFGQSSFPPTGEVQDEIWGIVAETLRLYNFHDFEKIKLIDQASQKESTYDKSQL